MHFRKAIFGLTLAAAAFANAAKPVVEERPLGPWQYHTTWQGHQRLRFAMLAAMQRGDLAAWEAAARAGVKLIPGDATWHYNLACALSRKNEKGLALTELSNAIKFGFRDANAIEKDSDFENVRKLPRFKELVGYARKLADFPVAGRPVPSPAVAPVGGTLRLTGTNVVWDFDAGVYHALAKLVAPKGGLAVSPRALSYKGPAAQLLCAWLSEGTASGNVGDLYVNGDRNHSVLAVGDFPFMTKVAWGDDAVAANVDVDFPTIAFPADSGVIGNVSRANLHPVMWRSLGRAVVTDAEAARRMDLLYLGNQIWFFPAVNDFGGKFGDVFSSVAPFSFNSIGMSWSDQPFARAAAAASAALVPPTKRAILERRLFGPTMQWLLRRSAKGIKTENDYLSPRAHPAAFAKASLDELALVERAHYLKPEDVPPAVALAVVNSRTFPIPMPQPGRDYPDAVGEFTYATRTAIGVVLRAPHGERTFLFRAQSFPPPANEAESSAFEFTWRVVAGEDRRVKIEQPLGETLNGPANGFAQIKVDRRGMTNRVTVACFARKKGGMWGAPSFVSFAPVTQEVREYAPDGRWLSIDYAGDKSAYTDPSLALPRQWKDVYEWAKDGRILGFSRWQGGKKVAEFTPQGERIVERKADGRPAKTVPVSYVPRQQGPDKPNELTWVDAPAAR